MKKEYINPEIEVVKLVSNPLLQDASPNGQNIDPTQSFDGPSGFDAPSFIDNGDSNESW